MSAPWVVRQGSSAPTNPVHIREAEQPTPLQQEGPQIAEDFFPTDCRLDVEPLPCFVCGSTQPGLKWVLQKKLVARTTSLKSGRQIAIMFDSMASLRDSSDDPECPRVEVGACEAHRSHLHCLQDLVRETGGAISQDIVRLARGECLNDPAKRVVSVADGATLRRIREKDLALLRHIREGNDDESAGEKSSDKGIRKGVELWVGKLTSSVSDRATSVDDASYADLPSGDNTPLQNW